MNQNFPIENNHILITGGTSGIGLELVKTFYEYKNQLVVVSRDADKLAKLKITFPNISTIACDLTSLESVQDLINICLKKYPEINILINNAGMQHNYNWLEDQTANNKIIEETNINFISPMLLSYGLLSILKTKKFAAIINVSSGLAFAPKKSAPIYCGAKAALHIATKALRYQLEKTNIQVFEIIPPLVDTNMTQGRGRNKISPQVLVREFIKNYQNSKLESNIGKVKLLRFIQRLSPAIADRILKNG